MDHDLWYIPGGTFSGRCLSQLQEKLSKTPDSLLGTIRYWVPNYISLSCMTFYDFAIYDFSFDYGKARKI